MDQLKRLFDIKNEPPARALAVMLSTLAVMGVAGLIEGTDSSNSHLGEVTLAVPQRGMGSFAVHCVGASGPDNQTLSSALVVQENIGTPQFTSEVYPNSPFCPPVGFEASLTN